MLLSEEFLSILCVIYKFDFCIVPNDSNILLIYYTYYNKLTQKLLYKFGISTIYNGYHSLRLMVTLGNFKDFLKLSVTMSVL